MMSMSSLTVDWRRGLLAVTIRVGKLRLRSVQMLFFFFLNDPPPTEISPFPLPAPLRIGGVDPLSDEGGVEAQPRSGAVAEANGPELGRVRVAPATGDAVARRALGCGQEPRPPAGA